MTHTPVAVADSASVPVPFYGRERRRSKPAPPTAALLEADDCPESGLRLHAPLQKLPQQMGDRDWRDKGHRIERQHCSLGDLERPCVYLGSIIALSQVLDAIKDVFPVNKRHKVLSEHVNQIESLFIDAQLEWENIFTGHYSDDEIANRRHKLMKLQHEAEVKNFPEGLPEQKPDFFTADAEAVIYFENTYTDS